MRIVLIIKSNHRIIENEQVKQFSLAVSIPKSGKQKLAG